MDLRAKPFYLNDEQIAWVKEAMDKLTTRQKIGQLFCIMGDDLTVEERITLVGEYGIGGMLFRPNPSKTILDWYAPLDKAAPVPMLKAANLEEGGAGAITDGTYFGSQMQVAATDETEMAEKLAAVCASEGMSVGCNINYAPVCDIDVNFRNPITNVRTFGSDEQRVLRMASAYVKKLQSYGMAACAKHFPGDGVDFRDHHLHPTYNSLSAEEWYNTFGKIYQTLIDEGLLCVMVGHIMQPAVQMEINPALSFEDCMPASLSPELLKGVLREKFGFNGLITTDATIMGGFCQVMDRSEALPATVMRGCDMIVFNTDIMEDLKIMEDALANGLLTEERLTEAVTRVLALKAKVCFSAMPEKVPAKQWQEECADKAITLVKNKAGILPLDKNRFRVIRLVTLGNDSTCDGSMTQIAKEKLEAEGFTVECYNPAEDVLHGSRNLPKDRLTLHLANLTHRSNQTVVRVTWWRRHALDNPRYLVEEESAVLSFANPYLLQDMPRVKTFVNCYTATKVTICAAIDKLLGKSEFKGVSPVDPFCGLPDTKI